MAATSRGVRRRPVVATAGVVGVGGDAWAVGAGGDAWAVDVALGGGAGTLVAVGGTP